MTRPPRDEIRLAVVLSHPTQYYSPWFQWLRLNTTLTFRVFYLWDFGVTSKTDPEFGTEVKWDVDLLSGYDSEFAPNSAEKAGAEHFFGFNNPDLTRRLAKWRPNVVLLFGYKWASHIRTVAWARLRGIPIVFRGDSTLIGRPSPSVHVRAALTLLFSQFTAFLYVGAANRDYFHKFGVPNRKLFFSPHSVNSALFNPQDARSIEEAKGIRSNLGLAPLTKVFLFAAKLVPGKQPMMLLEAFMRIKVPHTSLIFVGEGSEKAALQTVAAAGSRPTDTFSVHFLPFANQSEMPSRYLLGDIFVLPSCGDTWGLAINEAMHMGIPAIVSDRVGCQADLVEHGVTGWVFPFDAQAALEKALLDALNALDTPAKQAAVKANVERRILNYSYAQTSAGLQAALAALHS